MTSLSPVVASENKQSVSFYPFYDFVYIVHTDLGYSWVNEISQQVIAQLIRYPGYLRA